MKRHSPIENYKQAVRAAYQFLAVRVSWSSRSGAECGIHAATLAKGSGMTRLEADLALRCLVHHGLATLRRGGRYYPSDKLKYPEGKEIKL